MDALRAEIASKRKTLDNGTSRPNKYMRRGDIERMKEEEEQKAREEAAKKAELEEIQKAALPKVRPTNQPSPSTLKGTDTSLELRVPNPAAAPRLKPPRYLTQRAQQPPQARRVSRARRRRHPQTRAWRSTSPTRRRSGVCAPRASRFGCSASRTRTGVFACARWSSSRRRATSGSAGRTTFARPSRTSR